MGEKPTEPPKTDLSSDPVINYPKKGPGFWSDIARSLFSSDRPTRRAALTFFLLVIAFLVIFGQGVLTQVHRVSQRIAHRSQSTSVSAEKASSHSPAHESGHEGSHGDSHPKAEPPSEKKMVEVGKFTIPLKVPEAESNRRKRPMSVGRVTIFVNCDQAETCQLIQEHIAQVKDQVASAILPMDRDVLFSLEGKENLKKILIERINLWLPHGRVTELFFSDLVLG